MKPNELQEKHVIGLTGNIATGKSTILALAAERGAKTIDADKVGHAILHIDYVKQQLRIAYGDEVFDEDGTIIRPKLGRIVFSDSAQLKKLEAITHPAIRQEIGRQMTETKAPVIIIEAIKLLEGPLHTICDVIWVTWCDPETQVLRMVNVRGMSEVDAWQRVNAQSAHADKIKRADVIFNTNQPINVTMAEFASAWNALG